MSANLVNFFTQIGRISWNFLLKFGGFCLGSIIAAGGVAFGIVIGCYIICKDIKIIIDFYKERLKSRLLAIDSFSPVYEFFNKLSEN